MVRLRQLRAAVFVAVGAFMLLGPAYPQVLMGPDRTAKRPWLPMAWQMYHRIGTGMCQGTFWSEQDGKRVDIPRERVESAMGGSRGSVRSGQGRRIRENDALFTLKSDANKAARSLCAESNDANIHAFVRCSPPAPGKWEVISDGQKNLCLSKRSKDDKPDRPERPERPERSAETSD